MAKAAEAEKIRKYGADARRLGWDFIPFIIETTGGWGPRAAALIHDLAAHAHDHSLIPKEEALKESPRLFSSVTLSSSSAGSKFTLSATLWIPPTGASDLSIPLPRPNSTRLHVSSLT